MLPVMPRADASDHGAQVSLQPADADLGGAAADACIAPEALLGLTGDMSLQRMTCVDEDQRALQLPLWLSVRQVDACVAVMHHAVAGGALRL